jgi:hypothetical protein
MVTTETRGVERRALWRTRQAAELARNIILADAGEAATEIWAEGFPRVETVRNAFGIKTAPEVWVARA